MKKLYLILFPLIIVILLAVLVSIDYLKAKVLSISVASQTISEELIIDSIEMPGNGFAYIFQNSGLDSNGGLFIGGTDFLTKGSHKNVAVKIVKPQLPNLNPKISKFTIRLIEDTTGERLIDTTDDKPFKSVFGFEFSKEFLSL